MPFRDNSVLITTASTVNVVANGPVIDNYFGTGGATAFIVADGNVGDDRLLDFGADDSIITGKKIFDGNNDGFIAFGGNGVLDIDRTSGGNSAAARGPDQLQVVGPGGDIFEIRYLGTKGGNFVYADAATLRNLATANGDGNVLDDSGVVEGTVDSETISASGAGTVILFDNDLGLNLGGDTVTNFGNDDALVFTSKLFDSDGDDDVEFFGNLVLDVSTGTPQSSDPSTGPGGQIDIDSPDQQAVYFLGEQTIGLVTYYYYGTVGSTFTVPGDA